MSESPDAVWGRDMVEMGGRVGQWLARLASREERQRKRGIMESVELKSSV